jgi:hypothetical protein
MARTAQEMQLILAQVRKQIGVLTKWSPEALYELDDWISELDCDWMDLGLPLQPRADQSGRCIPTHGL